MCYIQIAWIGERTYLDSRVKDLWVFPVPVNREVRTIRTVVSFYPPGLGGKTNPSMN